MSYKIADENNKLYQISKSSHTKFLNVLLVKYEFNQNKYIYLFFCTRLNIIFLRPTWCDFFFIQLNAPSKFIKFLFRYEAWVVLCFRCVHAKGHFLERVFVIVFRVPGELL